MKQILGNPQAALKKRKDQANKVRELRYVLSSGRCKPSENNDSVDAKTSYATLEECMKQQQQEEFIVNYVIPAINNPADILSNEFEQKKKEFEKTVWDIERLKRSLSDRQAGLANMVALPLVASDPDIVESVFKLPLAFLQSDAGDLHKLVNNDPKASELSPALEIVSKAMKAGLKRNELTLVRQHADAMHQVAINKKALENAERKREQLQAWSRIAEPKRDRMYAEIDANVITPLKKKGQLAEFYRHLVERNLSKPASTDVIFQELANISGVAVAGFEPGGVTGLTSAQVLAALKEAFPGLSTEELEAFKRNIGMGPASDSSSIYPSIHSTIVPSDEQIKPAEFQKIQEEKERLEAELDVMVKRLKEGVATVAELEARVSRAEMENHGKEMKEVRTELHQQTEEIMSLRRERNELQELLQKTTPPANVDWLNVEKQGLEAQLADMKMRLDEATGVIKEFEKEEKEAPAIQESRALLAEQYEKVTKLKNEKSNLVQALRANNNVSSETRHLEQTLAVTQSQLVEVVDAVKALEKEVNSRTDLQKEVNDLMAVIASQTHEVERLRAEKMIVDAMLKKPVPALTVEVGSLKKDLENVEKLRKRADALAEQNNTQVIKLKKYVERIAYLHDMLGTSRKISSITRDEHLQQRTTDLQKIENMRTALKLMQEQQTKSQKSTQERAVVMMPWVQTFRQTNSRKKRVGQAIATRKSSSKKTRRSGKR